MTDYNIAELLSRGKSAEHHFAEKLGYNTAQFGSVMISKASYITYHFNLRDDFQEGLPYERRYHHGPCEILPDEDFYGCLERWPNREQRELYILAQQVAPLTDMAKEIQSAQVLAFVERLKPDLDELRRRLSHDPEVK